jgi:hypothetical protein
MSPDKPGQRGATFVAKPDRAEILAQTLTQRGVRHDQRKTGFRFSVHAYTPDTDVAILAEILRNHAA